MSDRLRSGMIAGDGGVCIIPGSRKSLLLRRTMIGTQ